MELMIIIIENSSAETEGAFIYSLVIILYI